MNEDIHIVSRPWERDGFAAEDPGQVEADVGVAVHCVEQQPRLAAAMTDALFKTTQA